LPFSRCSAGWRPLFGQLPEPLGAIDDDRLRLIFTCCHPALALETRVALTLRMVGGLTVSEIARAFLVAETTMGQRIARAKAKIRLAWPRSCSARRFRSSAMLGS
jgi:RNA polymerase sigma-70 factor (ECF subfamily)